MPRWHSVHAAHPETSAKTVSLRNGLSATIHSLKFTKTCHERNLTCTKKHVLQCFTMIQRENYTIQAGQTTQRTKDTQDAYQNSVSFHPADPAVQQRCSSGAAVASKPLPGRASQLWGWAPSRPSRHGTMHWRTAEGSKAFTMFYHAFPPTPFKEIDMKSHAELGWFMHHDIWSYLLCCHTTLLHDTTSIYIYTHIISI